MPTLLTIFAVLGVRVFEGYRYDSQRACGCPCVTESNKSNDKPGYTIWQNSYGKIARTVYLNPFVSMIVSKCDMHKSLHKSYFLVPRNYFT
ncbi:hypothetical protein GGR51DRAFT_278890 [Nemania sp. FL0031]|nr:hypothetical protein GGR51DRAFT_278890 [Nemania sp. FL0031]